MLVLLAGSLAQSPLRSASSSRRNPNEGQLPFRGSGAQSLLGQSANNAPMPFGLSGPTPRDDNRHTRSKPPCESQGRHAGDLESSSENRAHSLSSAGAGSSGTGASRSAGSSCTFAGMSAGSSGSRATLPDRFDLDAGIHTLV